MNKELGEEIKNYINLQVAKQVAKQLQIIKSNELAQIEDSLEKVKINNYKNKMKIVNAGPINKLLYLLENHKDNQINISTVNNTDNMLCAQNPEQWRFDITDEFPVKSIWRKSGNTVKTYKLGDPPEDYTGNEELHFWYIPDTDIKTPSFLYSERISIKIMMLETDGVMKPNYIAGSIWKSELPGCWKTVKSGKNIDHFGWKNK